MCSPQHVLGAMFPASGPPGSKFSSGPPGSKFSVRSTLELVMCHPQLVNSTVMSHPSKLIALLRHADVDALNQLLDRAPKDRLNLVLNALLQSVSPSHLVHTFVPLLNAKELHSTITGLLRVLAPAGFVLLIRDAPAQNLAIVLTAPEEKLSPFIAGIHADRFASSVVPILQEPPELISGKLVPLLYQVDHPERISAFVNFIEPAILLAIMRETPLSRFAAFINALDEDDVKPGGNLIQLMSSLVAEPHLVHDKVIPLIQRARVKKLMPFLKRVRLDQLMPLLRLNDVDSIVRLVEHTNAELVGALTDIRIENTVAVAAGALAKVLSSPTLACAVAKTMDALENGIQTVDVAKNEGKRVRGAGTQDKYQLGDITRGIIAKLDVAQGVTARIDSPLLRTVSGRRAILQFLSIAFFRLFLRRQRFYVLR